MIRLKLHLQYGYIERMFNNIGEAYSFIKDLGREVITYQVEKV
jgi:hypothetical protein